MDFRAFFVFYGAIVTLLLLLAGVEAQLGMFAGLGGAEAVLYTTGTDFPNNPNNEYSLLALPHSNQLPIHN